MGTMATAHCAPIVGVVMEEGLKEGFCSRGLCENTLTPLLLLQVDFGPLTPAPANYAPTPTGTSKCYSYSCPCNTELVSSVLQ